MSPQLRGFGLPPFLCHKISTINYRNYVLLTGAFVSSKWKINTNRGSQVFDYFPFLCNLHNGSKFPHINFRNQFSYSRRFQSKLIPKKCSSSRNKNIAHIYNYVIRRTTQKKKKTRSSFKRYMVWDLKKKLTLNCVIYLKRG